MSEIPSGSNSSRKRRRRAINGEVELATQNIESNGSVSPLEPPRRRGRITVQTQESVIISHSTNVLARAQPNMMTQSFLNNLSREPSERQTHNYSSQPPQPVQSLNVRIQLRDLLSSRNQEADIPSSAPEENTPENERVEADRNRLFRMRIRMQRRREALRQRHLPPRVLTRNSEEAAFPSSTPEENTPENELMELTQSLRESIRFLQNNAAAREFSLYRGASSSSTRQSSGIARENASFVVDRSNSTVVPRPSFIERPIPNTSVEPQSSYAESKKANVTTEMAFPGDILNSFGPEGLKDDDDEEITEIEEMVFQKLLRKKLVCDICMIHMKQYRCITCFYSFCKQCFNSLSVHSANIIKCPQCRSIPAQIIPIVLPKL